MTEEMGIDVDMKPPYGGSEYILRALAGCPTNGAPCDDAARQNGDFVDPPEIWVAAEVWTTSKEEKRLMSYCGTAGPIGYASTPSLQTYQRVHVASEGQGELIGYWRSLYRSSANGFYSRVADVDTAIRQLTVPMHFDWAFGCTAVTCSQPGLIRPGTENGAAVPASYLAALAAVGIDVSSDGWFYAPACRGDNATCVPVVLGSRVWNFQEWCVVAIEQNLPLAITFLGWFGEIVAVSDLFGQSYSFLFYWWRPDNTFLSLSPQMTFFKEDVLRIRQFQYTNKVIWPGIREVDEDVYSFLSKVYLTDTDMEAMMQQMTATNKGELACNWVKDNEARWRNWLPNKRNCLRGFFYNTSVEKCMACDAGTVTSERGMTECTRCDEGRYAKDIGQTECANCEPGKYARRLGSQGCFLCPYGTYGNVSALASCFKCVSPSYTTVSLASLDISSCVCPAGSYKPRASETCVACPRNMTCALGSEEANLPASPAQVGAARGIYPMVDLGYYTTYGQPFNVFKCGLPSHCVGGPPESCAGGRLGFNCAECPSGFTGSKDGCVECTNLSKVLFPLLLVPLAILIPLVLYYGTNAHMVATTPLLTGVAVSCGVIITSAQIMGIFARLSVPWPDSIENMLSFFSIFHAHGADVGKNCFFGFSPILVYVFEFVPVLIVVFLIFSFHFASKIVCPRLGRDPWNHNKSINTAGTFLQVVFIMLCGSAVRPIQCYTNPNGTKSNTSFPQVLCWEGGDHSVMLWVSAPILFLVIVPFMAVNVWAAFRLPAKTVKKGGNAGMVARFRYLVYRFRPDAWWWGVVFSVRQLMIAFAATVQPDDPKAQIIYMVAVLMMYLGAVGRAWPWRNRELNLLDTASITLFLLVAVNVGSFIPPTVEHDSHESLLIFFMSLMFAVFGVFGAYGLMVLYRRGFGGFYGWVYPGDKTFNQFAEEWLTFTLFHAKRTEEEIAAWMHAMNDFDRQVIDQVIGISQGFSIKGCRKLISNTAPERLTLDLSGPPMTIPKPVHFKRSAQRFATLAASISSLYSKTASTRTNTSHQDVARRVVSEGSEGDSRASTPEPVRPPKRSIHSFV